jgi:hypothetical protein
MSDVPVLLITCDTATHRTIARLARRSPFTLARPMRSPLRYGGRPM